MRDGARTMPRDASGSGEPVPQAGRAPLGELSRDGRPQQAKMGTG